MRIGKSNPYKYINNNKPKVPVSNVEKNKSIDEYQRKAIKEVEKLRKELKEADTKMKKMRDTSQIQLRCTTISRRIISGHKVPKSDYIYLAKHDSALYQKSIILRIEREKPLKFKSVAEHEKINNFDIEKFCSKNKDPE